MKIYYIANIRFPTERAHGIQIMEMCQAFADLGHEVELVVPRRHTEIKDDPYTYYDVRRNFQIKKLWCLDTVGWGKIGFWIQSLTFTEVASWYLLGKSGTFFTRDELVAVFLKAFGKKVVWEAHMGHKNFLIKTLIKLGVPAVVISEGLQDLYKAMGASKITVAPDGADVSRFDISKTQSEARTELGLPEKKKIVLYKGSLIPWKGAGTLAEAAFHIKAKNIDFVFIGGTPEDVERFKEEYGRYPGIVIKGNRPRKETPIYQKAADILVIPNSAKEDISKLYTSPMKLFGYMAGGVPIVASDLPSLREVLGEGEAYFFKPDDAKSLAHTIDHALTHRSEALNKARSALEKAREYSWESRAKKILDFIN